MSDQEIIDFIRRMTEAQKLTMLNLLRSMDNLPAEDCLRILLASAEPTPCTAANWTASPVLVFQ